MGMNTTNATMGMNTTNATMGMNTTNATNATIPQSQRRTLKEEAGVDVELIIAGFPSSASSKAAAEKFEAKKFETDVVADDAFENSITLQESKPPSAIEKTTTAAAIPEERCIELRFMFYLRSTVPTYKCLDNNDSVVFGVFNTTMPIAVRDAVRLDAKHTDVRILRLSKNNPLKLMDGKTDTSCANAFDSAPVTNTTSPSCLTDTDFENVQAFYAVCVKTSMLTASERNATIDRLVATGASSVSSSLPLLPTTAADLRTKLMDATMQTLGTRIAIGPSDIDFKRIKDASALKKFLTKLPCSAKTTEQCTVNSQCSAPPAPPTTSTTAAAASGTLLDDIASALGFGCGKASNLSDCTTLAKIGVYLILASIPMLIFACALIGLYMHKRAQFKDQALEEEHKEAVKRKTEIALAKREHRPSFDDLGGLEDDEQVRGKVEKEVVNPISNNTARASVIGRMNALAGKFGAKRISTMAPAATPEASHSKLSREEAALKIQRQMRGFVIRKQVKDWEYHFTDDNDKYFYNTQTGESRWDPPEL